jgi:proline-specific peptidase
VWRRNWCRASFIIPVAAAACAQPSLRQAAPSPPLATTDSSRLAVPGGMIWYRVVGGGAGTPIILVHGGPGLMSVYLKPLEALGDERAVIRYDQLGAGYADRTTDTTLFNIPRYVEELDSLRRFLAVGEMHVFGHSWGATLALEYYRAHPANVASLILASDALDVASYFAKQVELRAGISGDFHRAAQLQDAGLPYDTTAALAHLREFNTRHLARTVPPGDRDTMRARSNPLPAMYMMGDKLMNPTGTLKHYDGTVFLKDVRVPVLFLAGESDQSGPEIVERHAALTPGARFVLIPGSGHMLTWDNAAATVAAVSSFLREADRQHR